MATGKRTEERQPRLRNAWLGVRKEEEELWGFVFNTEAGVTRQGAPPAGVMTDASVQVGFTAAEDGVRGFDRTQEAML